MMRGARMRLFGGAGFALFLAVGLVAATAQPGASAPQRARHFDVPSGFTDTAVFTGLTLPTAVAFSPDGRIFVALKSGIIDVFDNASDNTPTTWADLRRQTFDNYDRGLLGLVVDPKLGTPGHDYVYALYAEDAGPGQTPPVWHDHCVQAKITINGCVVTGSLVRITVNPGGSAGGKKVLIRQQWCQQFTSHSIGHLAFGPDGDLYVSGGEGASYSNPADYGQLGGTGPNPQAPPNACGDPPNPAGTPDSLPTAEGGSLRSQSPRRAVGEPVLLSGSVLRVNPTTGAGVKGNPMFNKNDKSSNASRIIAYGFRNPFRFTFRPGTNEIWVSEAGAGQWEELDRITSPTETKTPDYGWPCYEGTSVHQPFDQSNICQGLFNDTAAPAVPPYFEYSHNAKVGSGDACATQGGSSVISGIDFTASNANYPASYQGAVFFSDYVRGCMWVMFKGGNGLPDASTLQTFVHNSPGAGPVDIENDPATGNLWYVDLADGEIHRVTHSGP
jgi:glucose/arabinose dehydrogenase